MVQGQVICFTTDPSINPGVRCGGLRVFPNPPTVRECCLGNGFFYRLSAGDETCFECVGEWSLDCCLLNVPCELELIKSAYKRGSQTDKAIVSQH